MPTVKPKTIHTNHHLGTIVIGLTAVLLALGIYTFLYAQKPVAPATTHASDSLTSQHAAMILPDSPTGTTSVTGSIEDLTGRTQLVVTVRTITNGTAETHRYLVNYTKQTPTYTLTLNPTTTAVGKTSTSTASLKIGTPVQILTTETIGTVTPLTAREIDILSS